MMSISDAVLQGIAAMWTRRFLGLSAAVLLAMAGLGYGLHVAYADDAGRAIPTIGVTSPSPETIQVVWGAPVDTDTLSSYRVMWAPEGRSHSYSEANTDTGGNAYPPADATSYTITGLAAGDYHVKVRARYDDGSGPFKGSAVVRVAAAAEREAEDPDRSIPAIGVASPAAGTIEVIWGAPSDTDTLNSYRVMWAPEGRSHSYSEANTDTGGNAYPPADATSYTITGLAAGDYHVKVRARYDDNGSGPFKGSSVVEGTPEPAAEPEIAEQQAAEPCADPRIESVGGSATNGSALWVWRSVARDPDVDPQGCWYDFRLSYSDDYGATFTETAVVRGAVGTTDNETYTIDGTTYQRNIERHGAGVPELSIVSALRVSVGCDGEGENCAHSMDSTDASFDQYYYSRHENKTAGANTKALLVPANSSEGGNASVTGWLEYDDTETHTYRIAMTKGKTYVFDETYRKWALESSDWRAGAPHFYLPDEFRISLYTKNSAGQLVPVSGFQNQPEHGWQALDAEPGFQRFGSNYDTASLEAFFESGRDLQQLLDEAHQFPPGSRYRTGCAASGFDNNCGWGLLVGTDRGRQMRTASYAAPRNGTYYLTVTRHEDETIKRTVTDPSTGEVTIVDTGKGGPVYAPYSVERWMVDLGLSSIDGNTYLSMLRVLGPNGDTYGALPYYELSAQVHGPTLSSLQIAGREIGFLPGRFDYVVQVPSSRTEVTIAAMAAHDDATVTINPADANATTAGHQVSVSQYPSSQGAAPEVTITVTRGDDSETYTIELSRP